MPIYYSLNSNSRVVLLESSFDANYSYNPDLDSLSEFVKIVSGKEISIDEKYDKMASILSLKQEYIPSSVPRFVFRNHLTEISSLLQDIFSSDKNNLYFQNYLKIRTFIDSLIPGTFDRVNLDKLIKNQRHEGPRLAISKFFPDSKGKTRNTVYSMAGTVTGRLTVAEGPNILTCPSGVRNWLKSSIPKGRIVQIDVVAAEPKFALHLKGDSIPVDAYSDISKSVFSSSLSRSQVKIATLCALYGQSAKKLSAILKPGMSAMGIIEKVKSYFGYRSLKKELLNNFNSKSFSNHLGRPLMTDSDSLLVSHFLQSSVAEASLIMFSDFCKKNPGVLPHYVIHDALIASVDLDFCQKFPDGTNIALMYNNWKFEATVSFLSDN